MRLFLASSAAVRPEYVIALFNLFLNSIIVLLKVVQILYINVEKTQRNFENISIFPLTEVFCESIIEISQGEFAISKGGKG